MLLVDFSVEREKKEKRNESQPNQSIKTSFIVLVNGELNRRHIKKEAG